MSDIQVIRISGDFLEQCRECDYWHEDFEDEAGKWAPFCELFHGTGIPIPCSEKKPRGSASKVIE